MNVEKYMQIVPEIQSHQLEILIEFDKFCTENQLTYSLMWGTLLGAVRHDGFIPWDDDIDVGMPREDFDKLLDLSTNFNSNYFVQHYTTDNSFFPFIKIRENGTKMVMQSSKDGKFHQGIWIDVFPLDRVPKDKIKKKVYIARTWILQQIVISSLYSKTKMTTNFLNRQVRRLFYYLNKFFPENYFNKRLEKLLRKYKDTDGSYYDLVSGSPYSKVLQFSIDANDVWNPVKKEFEGKEFFVFGNYKTYLIKMFGDYNQLPPEDERYPHHNVLDLEFGEDLAPRIR